MKNTGLLKRIMSVCLVVALLLTTLPLSTLAVGGADALYGRVADANTMDNWKKYFDLTDLDTSNAGGVWTDKSVFTDASAFDGAVTMQDGGKNFLTALSAIAANKEVVGYSTIPTDTVLVLDLSGSMNQDEGDLVTAANDAIGKLLNENKNNRIGVVAYSASGSTGASTYAQSVTQLLPIGRYTTQNGRYLVANNNTVSLSSNLRIEGQTAAPAFANVSKNVSGGTYIQAGLWEAYEMFNAVPDSDIVIGDNNWQTGDHRMPILVLMSDGAPTTGTTYFADVKNSRYRSNQYGTVYASNVGNGSDSNMTAGQGFLVQLTASYIKNRIENKYRVHEENGAGRSLFYTLGFNVSTPTNTNINPNNIAYSVLNPDASTLTDTLWSTYKSGYGNTMQVNVKNRNGDNTNMTIDKNSYVTDKSYVDEYFPASGNGLATAFQSIVDEIILQSRYYPTHLEGGNPDFSGYVEFTDRLGAYMEVKHIHGIQLGDTFFDGHMMASKLADTTDGGLGTPEKPTALGDEFIRAVKARLGIADTAEAQALVAKAYADSQLYYNSASDWSNYIAWYAKADGTYVGFYDKDGTEPAPEGAVYINRSYGFLGETSGSIKNSDMMYMSVQVHTNIATGDQTVLWRIPAALVPMITYLITLDGVNVDTASNVRIAVENAADIAPIRLVYETGLRADLNPFNITRITEAPHVAADGHTRVFWNNYFDITAQSHDQHVTAMSEFTPNKDNERFYYTFDSAVFKKSGTDYILLAQNETPAAGGEYYHRRYVFKQSVATPVFVYERMSDASIAAAQYKSDYETLTGERGAWVVPKGTPARELQMYDEQKAANPTDSARMVFHPYIAEHNNYVYVDMNLGNNGRLAVTPATGIKITKTVDVFEPNTSDTFRFRITAPLTGSFDSWITAAGETPSGAATPAAFVGGVYEVTLKKDQTVWIAGIPAGTAYTVEEISDNDDYKVKSVHVNGVATGVTASGAVAQYQMEDIAFVNTALGESDLVITKRVVDADGTPVDIHDSVKFTMQVALTNAQGAPVSGTFAASGGTLTVPASGVFTVTLAEGESFVLRGVPEETRYTVTETNIPAGFTYRAAASTPSGVIDSTAADQALIVNTYAPVGVTGADVSVEVTKAISGSRTDWLAGESYTFTITSVEDGRVLVTDTIDSTDADKRFRFALTGESYATAGTYRYRITEQVGTQGGVTYDTAERRFAVVVADSDMDGDLEITAVNNELNTVVSGNWLVTADFNNVYAPVGSATAVINIDKAMSGNHSPAGYQFALYNADPTTAADAQEILRSALTDAAGKTAITLSYSAEDAGHTYTYWLAEVNHGETINNILYDNTVYEVKVTVRDDLDGTISTDTVISGVPAGATNPVFTNVYVPSASDYVTVSGKKVIDGDRLLNAGEFEFAITANTAGAPMPAETTVRNAADGSFAFPAIEFDDSCKGNTYTYTIVEKDTERIGGFDYDTTVYTVTVTVTDNGDQTVTATAAITANGTPVDDIVFTNTYDATDATVTLRGEKLLTGKTLQADEFTFALTPVTAGAPMPASATATNTARGEIIFGTITYAKAGTYVYRLAEVAGSDTRYDYDESVYTVTVTVTDNSRGVLSAAVSLAKDTVPVTDIVFRNGFVPTPIAYDLHTDFGGNKVLTGRPMQEGEFEFVLINAASGATIGKPVRNDANGAFRFPPMMLTATGIYHFKITETVGDARGVSYDTTSYHIRLEVVQDVNGALSIADKQLHKGVVSKQDVGGMLTEVTTYENITVGGDITFRNSYKADPVYVSLEAIKTLVGRDLVDGEFKFDLHKTDATYAYDASTLLQDDVTLTLRQDGTGAIAFAAEKFDKADTYHYVIVEDEQDARGVTADDTVYKVEITVTDNYNGDLVATLKVNGTAVSGAVGDTIRFNNVYAAAATDIVIAGTKKLEGRDLAAQEFSFELYDAAGTKLETVKNAADGSFAFAAIPVDAAGEYVYTVRESAGDAEGITYDPAVYTVKATVTDNLDGTFTVAYSYLEGTETASGITFVNVYTAPTPPPAPTPDPTSGAEDTKSPLTGDSTELTLLLALLFVSGGGIAIATVCGRKKKEAA